MELAIIISSLVANLITKYTKGNTVKRMTDNSNAVRVLNAVAGLIVSLIAYYFLGGALDMTQVQTYVEIIVTAVLTFMSSQGMYFLAKK